jgi:hypothetical protein
MAAGWDSTDGFKVPAGLSCSANRGGLCLFGLGAMFERFPPAQPAGSPGSPLGFPASDEHGNLPMGAARAPADDHVDVPTAAPPGRSIPKLD